ncbi:MAG: hypothetical protein WCD86_25240 [Ktedonobacteraceae bacterium]
MRMYTLTECCTLFGVNPKTFHKWLGQEGIRPQSSRADTRVRYLTQEQVEYLTHVYGRKLAACEELPSGERVASVSDNTLGERLDQYEQRLTVLEDQVRWCNEMLHTVQQWMEMLTVQAIPTSTDPVGPPPAQKRSSLERRSPSATRTKKNHRGKKLPQTLVLLRVFAEQHRVSVKQASAAGQSGKIAVVRGKWLVNSRWATEALDQRGRQEFYGVFHTKEGFLPCNDCPHEHVT